ncbi:RidA family protein [Streptomyces sp. STR69]|uniref:RidA family protein n=1 Tax=Streptomyces sp. STR69 TaxID=1796942 RepID=UPI0021C9475A|nr:Rid family hydrolase [Streptomyces sp. STR69]
MSDVKITVHSPEAPAAAGPYSHGVISRGTLFCSGQIALDPVSNLLLHAGDVAGQVTQCLDNLNAVAASAGTDLREYGLRTTIYVANLDRDWPIVNEAYGRWFGDATPPARVTFGVAMLPLGASVEIDAYVAVPRSI